MASELLTVKSIENAKSADKPWTLNDGGGLFVLVHPNGSKYFQLRCTLHGKEKLVRLGVFPDLTLAKARARASEARKLVVDGIDPVQHKRAQAAKRAATAATTFQSVADQWLEIKQRTLAPSTSRKIIQTFRANVFPRFGRLPIKEIDARMVRDAMQVMEKRGATELMEKSRTWIRDVFDFAQAEGLIDSNPIPQRDLILQKHQGESHPYLKNKKDVGLFLRNLFDYPGRAETRLAIWLQMLLVTRPGELRQAEWIEFDLEKRIWTIPIERMKTRKHMTEPHLVTLSKQAVSALKELHELTSYSKSLLSGRFHKRINWLPTG